MLKTLIAAAFVVSAAGPALAAGDLAIKAKKIELEIGGGEDGYGVSQPEIELETGKSYTLELKEVGPHGCEFEAEDLTRVIWIRNIEVGHVTITASGLEGFELDDDGEVALTFVPIRPGSYDWSCEGLDEKGVKGTIVVK